MKNSAVLFAVVFLLVGVSFVSAADNLLVAGKAYSNCSCVHCDLVNFDINISCSHSGISTIKADTTRADGSYGVVFSSSQCASGDSITFSPSSACVTSTTISVPEATSLVTPSVSGGSSGGGAGSTSCYVDSVCVDWSNCNDGVQVCMDDERVEGVNTERCFQNSLIGTTRECSTTPTNVEEEEETPQSLLGITGNAINGLTGAATGVLGETGLGILGILLVIVLVGLGVVTIKKAEWKSVEKKK